MLEKMVETVYTSSSSSGMGKNSSSKVIVNDLLCFIYNHMLTMSPPSIRRLCLETYSSLDIALAIKVLKDLLLSMKKRSDVPAGDEHFSKDEQALDDILFLLKKEMPSLPQIVSSGRHIPRFNAYRDVLCMSSLLDEMQELKHMVKEMHTQLYTEMFSIKSDIFSLKLNSTLHQDQQEDTTSQDLNSSSELVAENLTVEPINMSSTSNSVIHQMDVLATEPSCQTENALVSYQKPIYTNENDEEIMPDNKADEMVDIYSNDGQPEGDANSVENLIKATHQAVLDQNSTLQNKSPLMLEQMESQSGSNMKVQKLQQNPPSLTHTYLSLKAGRSAKKQALKTSPLVVATANASNSKHASHKCEICGYTSNRTDVTRHVRVHTGEKPFHCLICNKRFALRSNMLKHKRKHHTAPSEGLLSLPPGPLDQ